MRVTDMRISSRLESVLIAQMQLVAQPAMRVFLLVEVVRDALVPLLDHGRVVQSGTFLRSSCCIGQVALVLVESISGDRCKRLAFWRRGVGCEQALSCLVCLLAFWLDHSVNNVAVVAHLDTIVLAATLFVQELLISRRLVHREVLDRLRNLADALRPLQRLGLLQAVGISVLAHHVLRPSLSHDILRRARLLERLLLRTDRLVFVNFVPRAGVFHRIRR